MSQAKSLLGILRIANASGDGLDTRIRLQKEAFLLAVAGSNYFDVSEFDYHHYGPYSRTVSDALRLSVSYGFLEEEVHYFDDGNGGAKYSYKMTESGSKFLTESPDLGFEDRDIISYLNRKHWRCLELAATVRYLQIKDGMENQDDAFGEALRLKPATAPFVTEAKELLSRF